MSCPEYPKAEDKSSEGRIQTKAVEFSLILTLQ
jgi:hypothetical protein